MPEWRKCLGPEGRHVLAAVLQQRLVRDKLFDRRRMVSDTMAQAKHVAYPTDTALLDKRHRKLLGLLGQAKAMGAEVAQGLCSLRQTAKRVVLAAS